MLPHCVPGWEVNCYPEQPHKPPIQPVFTSSAGQSSRDLPLVGEGDTRPHISNSSSGMLALWSELWAPAPGHPDWPAVPSLHLLRPLSLFPLMGEKALCHRAVPQRQEFTWQFSLLLAPADASSPFQGQQYKDRLVFFFFKGNILPWEAQSFPWNLKDSEDTLLLQLRIILLFYFPLTS